MALLRVPLALETEHEELLDALRHVLRSHRSGAPVARRLLEFLGPHCDREAEAVGPLLALLTDPPPRPGPRASTVADRLLDAFRRAHPALVQEHRSLAGLAEELRRAAVEGGDDGVACLARRLLVHARLYDTVIFPAALLAGEVTQQALAAPAPTAA